MIQPIPLPADIQKMLDAQNFQPDVNLDASMMFAAHMCHPEPITDKELFGDGPIAGNDKFIAAAESLGLDVETGIMRGLWLANSTSREYQRQVRARLLELIEASKAQVVN